MDFELRIKEAQLREAALAAKVGTTDFYYLTLAFHPEGVVILLVAHAGYPVMV